MQGDCGQFTLHVESKSQRRGRMARADGQSQARTEIYKRIKRPVKPHKDLLFPSLLVLILILIDIDPTPSNPYFTPGLGISVPSPVLNQHESSRPLSVFHLHQHLLPTRPCPREPNPPRFFESEHHNHVFQTNTSCSVHHLLLIAMDPLVSTDIS